MYLLYDVIQLRNSSLANTLLIKRSQWNSVTRDIESLTTLQLQNAAKQLAAGQPTEEPAIRRLLKNITTIGVQIPGSFFQKLQMRAEIRGLLIREGMPAFWMTINPSDLQNPLVLVFAGAQYSTDSFPTATTAVRQEIAMSDPVAVARFFHSTCKAILDGLLRGKSSELGALGDVSNYFGVVESNGRGMLHLHTLIWVRGNLGFAHLRDRLRAETNFATRMIQYLETIIMHSIYHPDNDNPETAISNIPPTATGPESDIEFCQTLFKDSNRVASIKQLHAKNHTATCFKYGRRHFGKTSCRFGMPRDIVAASHIDANGVIQLTRNHAWVNPWNPTIASCIRSNHDISWIPTVSKSLALVYYITNYATKDDVSPLQMLTKAALLRQAIDHAHSTQSPSAADLRLRQRNMVNFSLRCFNSLSQDREVSGVQVASTLLQLPSYYTINYNFTRINLWWLRQYVRSFLPLAGSQPRAPPDLPADEPCVYNANTAAPASLFDNYKWRGQLLSSLCLFEYCMLVRTRHVRDATTQDIEFDQHHPRCLTHMQRLAQSPSQTATVTLQGQLSEFQAAEDSLPGGHPSTDAILNDMAEVLLGLFIPWENLPSLLRQSTSTPENSINRYYRVWTAIEPSLPAYIRTFASNIELLLKSKEDCQVDALLRKQSADHTVPVDEDLRDEDPYLESDDESSRPESNIDETFSSETLLTAFSSISRLWDRELRDAQQRITALAALSLRCLSRHFDQLQPLDIANNTLFEAAGLRFVPPTLLQTWETCLGDISTQASQDINIGPAPDLDDFNADITDGILMPLLVEPEPLPDMEERRSRVGDAPTGASLSGLVSEIIPLNRKQAMVVQKILSEALSWASHPYNSSQRQQTLLYVGGEGGVGKSQIIKAIATGMDLLRRKHELILMAPTGAAADLIGGNTYHTSLGISLNRSRAAAKGLRVRRLWSRKTFMIIDEVSMIDLSTLSTINSHCKSARSLDRTSPDLFGGLPIVILMGDFYQFPPVRGQPLWKLPQNDADTDGRLIWHRFSQVIILDEQMRQTEDKPYQSLLRRARTGNLTSNDVLLLNGRTITSLANSHPQDTTAVVTLNSLRHVINRHQTENFALIRHQTTTIGQKSVHTLKYIVHPPTPNIDNSTTIMN
jgi:hypothetical protein